MPLLLQVAAAGGVAPALQQATGSSSAVIDEGSGGWPEVVDALEKAVAGAWPTALRTGLLGELQSKTGVVQRHSALRLSAACLEQQTLGPLPGGCREVLVLSPQQLDQLMNRMLGVTQVILEFLEYATSQGTAAAVSPLLVVGAVRLLGRFLADAPEAHEEAVQRLLPALLQLQVPHQPLTSATVLEEQLTAQKVWQSWDWTPQAWRLS
eukprot:gene5220-5457_t